MSMPWIYRQSTGELRHNGAVVGTGYSGVSGPARNNPQMEQISNTGPIPSGNYSIGPAFLHHRTGPFTMSLTPVDHNAFHRSGLLIHGDNRAHNASTGCIILGPHIREQISNSGDNQLSVMP